MDTARRRHDGRPPVAPLARADRTDGLRTCCATRACARDRRRALHAYPCDQQPLAQPQSSSAAVAGRCARRSPAHLRERIRVMKAPISELSSRSDDGVDVALLWQRRENTAVVAVVDHRTGEQFTLAVRDGDNPLDMFHHPFAYATHRLIEHRSGPLLENSRIAA